MTTQRFDTSFFVVMFSGPGRLSRFSEGRVGVGFISLCSSCVCVSLYCGVLSLLMQCVMVLAVLSSVQFSALPMMCAWTDGDIICWMLLLPVMNTQYS